MQRRGTHAGAVDGDVLVDHDLGAADVHVASREADGEVGAGVQVGRVHGILEIVEGADQVIGGVEQLHRIGEVDYRVVARHARRTVLEHEPRDAREGVGALVQPGDTCLGHVGEAGGEAVAVGGVAVGVVGDTVGIDGRVGARSATEIVVAGAASQRIVVAATDEQIASRAADEGIVAAVAEQRDVNRRPGDSGGVDSIAVVVAVDSHR